jgi:hypothetical protein
MKKTLGTQLIRIKYEIIYGYKILWFTRILKISFTKQEIWMHDMKNDEIIWWE